MTLSYPTASPSFWKRSAFLDVNEQPALIILLLKINVILICTYVGWVEYDGYLNDFIAYILIGWAASILFFILKLRTVGALLRLICMLLAMSLAAPLATAALAPVSAPLADDTLMRLDSVLLGTPAWPNVMRILGGQGFFLHVLSYAYVSLIWQLIALVVILCLLHKEIDAWRFTTAWGLGLLTCVVAFPLCPALGAYGNLHIDSSAVPDVLCHTAWRYPVTLQKFREGTFYILDANALEGIVSMPSFHACAAILLAWGFSRVPVMSWAMAALNLLMWVSSVPIGGHYIVDVMAGTLVAICAIFLSVRLVPYVPSGQQSLYKRYADPTLRMAGLWSRPSRGWAGRAGWLRRRP